VLKLNYKKAAILTALLSVLLCVTIVLPGCAPEKNADPVPSPDINKKNSYTSASVEGGSQNGGSFLVCGTSGRLDRVFFDGTVENIPLDTYSDLTQVLISPDITLISGKSGTLLYSRDNAAFTRCDGAGKADILGIAAYRGKYYAATGDGAILSSENGVSWKANTRLTDKPIIAIEAQNLCIMAITADTDIFTSADGKDWASQNYNEAYYGLMDPLAFRSLTGHEDAFILLAHLPGDEGSPVVMLSFDGGELWSIPLTREINDRPPEEFYPITANAARYFGEVLLVACDRGRILTYTDCPSCNLITETTSGDFHCIAVKGDTILAAGDDYEFYILSGESLGTASG